MKKEKKRNPEWTCLSVQIPKDIVASLHDLIEKKADAAGVPVPSTVAYIRMLIENDVYEWKKKNGGR
jgi:hypothetical protein